MRSTEKRVGVGMRGWGWIPSGLRSTNESLMVVKCEVFIPSLWKVASSRCGNTALSGSDKISRVRKRNPESQCRSNGEGQ